MRERLSYANVIATAALFLAFGGGAYAVSIGKNEVGSREIENAAVRSQEIKDDDVRAGDIEANAVGAAEVADGQLTGAEIADEAVSTADVLDGTLGGADLGDGSLSGADLEDETVTGADLEDETVTGADVADGSLDNDDIDQGSLNFSLLPGAGVLAAQMREIGGAGAVTYGPVSGRSLASTAIEDVAMAFPSVTNFGNLVAFVPADLAAGQSRTFTVVSQVSGGGTIFESDISCTINAGSRHCFDDDRDGVGALLVAVRTESSGAGLAATDPAYIGLGAETTLDPATP